MLAFSIILAVMSICFGAYCMHRIKKVQQEDVETERINQELAQKKTKLIKSIKEKDDVFGIRYAIFYLNTI